MQSQVESRTPCISNVPTWYGISFCNAEKIDFSQLPIEKKRNYYKCEKDYLTLSDIPPWSEGCKSRLENNCVSNFIDSGFYC